jgi:hypothetical protein
MIVAEGIASGTVSSSRIFVAPETAAMVVSRRCIRVYDDIVSGRCGSSKFLFDLLWATIRATIAAQVRFHAWPRGSGGAVAVLIDAKNARIAAWYASYGALPLLDGPLSLVLPLTAVEAALKAAKK